METMLKLYRAIYGTQGDVTNEELLQDFHFGSWYNSTLWLIFAVELTLSAMIDDIERTKIS